MASTFQIQDAACTKCTFFELRAAAGPDLGLCRFNPPATQPSAAAHGLWPVVAAQDWCGHYEPQAAAQAGLRAAE